MSSLHRYSLAAAAACLAALGACPSPSRPPPVQPSSVVTQPQPTSPSVPTPAGAPLLDPSGVSCEASRCAFHAGAAGYFRCLAGGAGACFHFGGPCQPVGACMFDPTARAFRSCAQVIEGTCLRYGAACEPAGTCWYDADDGLYRECLQRKPGACAGWGALCSPAGPQAQATAPP